MDINRFFFYRFVSAKLPFLSVFFVLMLLFLIIYYLLVIVFKCSSKFIQLVTCLEWASASCVTSYLDFMQILS